MNLQKALFKIISVFRKYKRQIDKNFKFALIGGLAVSVWGIVRATKDIDFLVLLENSTPQDLYNFLKAQKLKCNLIKGDIGDPIPLLLDINIHLDRNISIPVQLIIAAKKWQIDFIKTSKGIKLESRNIPILRLEELIISKLKAGGPQDIYDCTQLINVQKRKIDFKKLKSLADSAKVNSSLTRLFN